MLQSKLRSGDFDHILVIEQNQKTVSDDFNEEIDNWVEITTVRAKRIHKGGREGFEADQPVATNLEMFEFRYSNLLKNIDSTYRVHEKGEPGYFYLILVEKDRREGWIMVKGERKDV